MAILITGGAGYIGSHNGEEDKQRAIKIWKAFFSDRYFDEFLR